MQPSGLEDENNAEEEDIPGEIEKVIEWYSEDYDKLKDSIEKDRNTAKTDYFADLKLKEYYRNRRRIEDINEVYAFWLDQIEGAIKKAAEEKKPNNKNAKTYY